MFNSSIIHNFPNEKLFKCFSMSKWIKKQQLWYIDTMELSNQKNSYCCTEQLDDSQIHYAV